MIYYVIATLLTILIVGLPEFSSFHVQKTAVMHRRVWLFAAAAVPLLLLSSMRGSVGTDTWHTYTPEYLVMQSETRELTNEEEIVLEDCIEKYSMIEYGYDEEQAEALTLQDAYDFFGSTYGHTSPGFQFIERVLLFFNADVQWLYVVTSLFTLIFVFLAIFRQSIDPVLASLFFVITSNYFLSLNIVSQYMAIAVCLFACEFAEKRKPVPFVLLVLFAALFHTSALVFLPVYFLPKLEIKPLYCTIAIGVLLIAAPVGIPLLKDAVELIMPKYARYFGKTADFETIFFALGAAILIVGAYYWKEGKDKPYYKLWYYMNVLGMLSLCFSGNIPYMKRINYYFAAPHFLFLPLLISCEKDPKRRKMLKWLIIVLFIAETLISVGYMNKNGVLPYQFFFAD